jgi:hypothetical protein
MRFERSVPRCNQILLRRYVRCSCEILGQRLSGYRHARTIKQPGLEQVFQQHWCATELVQIVHRALTTRSKAAHNRCFAEDVLQIAKPKINFGFPSKCQHVQDAIRRTTNRGNRCCCIDQRRARDDIARSQIHLQQVHNQRTNLLAFLTLLGGNRGNGTGVGGRESDGFQSDAPRVE